jgi:rhomboid protease GluP
MRNLDYKQLGVKFRILYVPYLILSGGFILVYTGLRWWLDIELDILGLKREALNFWLPAIVAFTLSYLVFKNRLKILKLETKRNDYYFFYQLILVASLVIPTIIAQNYVEANAFKLVLLSNAEELDDHSKEKYIAISDFNIDKQQFCYYITSRSSGKNNQTLTYYIYTAVPFKNAANYWYGETYTKSISNYYSQTRKDSIFNRFLTETNEKIAQKSYKKVIYFKRVKPSDDYDGYEEAIAKKNQKSLSILEPQIKPFEQREGTSAKPFFTSIAVFYGLLLLLFGWPAIQKKELRKFKRRAYPSTRQLIMNTLKSTMLRESSVLWLVIANIVVFLVMVFSGVNVISPTPQELFAWGGLRKQEVLEGEYWRLLTAMFIHGGFIHLIMNSVGLLFSGFLLSATLDKYKLLIFYLLSGVAGGCVSMWWNGNTISVGASGAIYGLWGLLLVFNLLGVFNKDTQELNWIMLGSFAGIGLVFGMVGGVDNAAHLGGLLTGVLCGLGFVLANRRELL